VHVVGYELNSTTRTRPDPTGPARTCTDFFAAKLRWVRAARRQSPRGSGRVRVVEFSSKTTRLLSISLPANSGYVSATKSSHFSAVAGFRGTSATSANAFFRPRSRHHITYGWLHRRVADEVRATRSRFKRVRGRCGPRL